MKILLVGGTGYVGEAFQKLFLKEKISYYLFSTRHPLDKSLLRDTIANYGITDVINCAGFTGKPNVDSCEDYKRECLIANAYLPKAIAEICGAYCLHFLHISSGCIYNDPLCEKGLQPFTEFTEGMNPNFCFDNNKYSWYSGTKALGEQLVQLANYKSLICRLRIPFNGEVNNRNYIDKITNYTKLLNATNSFSHLDEFVRGCLYLLERNEMGIFNLTQPGYMTTKEIVSLLQNHNVVNSKQFYDSIEEFNKIVKAPRSNCVLDSSAAIKAGVTLTPIRVAMEKAIIEYNNNSNVV